MENMYNSLTSKASLLGSVLSIIVLIYIHLIGFIFNNKFFNFDDKMVNIIVIIINVYFIYMFIKCLYLIMTIMDNDCFNRELQRDEYDLLKNECKKVSDLLFFFLLYCVLIIGGFYFFNRNCVGFYILGALFFIVAAIILFFIFKQKHKFEFKVIKLIFNKIIKIALYLIVSGIFTYIQILMLK